jgi:hypothetical protein
MLPTKQLSTTTPRAQSNGASKAVNILFGFLSVVFTLLPIANIISVVTTTGADNLSNDYLQYVGLVDKVLNGGYNWLNYIPDTFYRTHSVALPVLLHIANAQFFHWNIYLELLAGIFFAFARLTLLFFALSSDLTTRQKLLLCPALSLLIFSNSQMSVFCYGDGALTIEMSLFGFALGLWGLTRKNNRNLAIVAMLAGGLISSFSWGNGLVTWLVLLLALLALDYRKPVEYITWAIGLSLSLLPYIQALVIAPLLNAGSARSGTTIVSLFNSRFLINMIGWPFTCDIVNHAQGLPAARAVGWVGLGFAATAVLLLSLARKADLWRKCAPALLLVGHGLISIWQIGVFRSLLAGWYTAVSITFWLGLLGLAGCFYQQLVRNEQSSTALRNAARIWSAALAIVLTALYVTTNLTYDDKTDMLYSRSPASASALRHYRTGPTYGESLLFQWGAGNPGLVDLLAAPLERHALSVFAPRQIWSLQGDFGLDTVTVRSKAGKESLPVAIWTTGISSAERLPWSDYRHLNLLMPCGDAITWKVSLPKGVTQAALHASAIPARTDQETVPNAPITFMVHLKGEAEAEQLAYTFTTSLSKRSWHDFTVPLSPFAGQSVTIRLSSRQQLRSTGAAAVFRYPFIELELNKPLPAIASSSTTPSNTDRSTDFVKVTDNDLLLDAQPITLQNCGNGQLRSQPISLNDGLSAFSHFVIKLSADQSIVPRVVTITLTRQADSTPLSFQIPLLADSKAHSYSYDLKLLPLDNQAKYSSLTISTNLPPAMTADDKIQVVSARFVRRAAVK